MPSSASNGRSAEVGAAGPPPTIAGTSAADSPTGPAPSARARTPWQLIAIFAISAAPVVLGTLVFWYWGSAGQTNYGQLLAPRQISIEGTALDGVRASLSQSHGTWRYIVFDQAGCDENCRRKLLYTRQLRIAAGRDQDRVDRVWIIEDGLVPDRELAGLFVDARVLRLSSPGDADHIAPGSERRGFIYLVDPYGNLMMRYPSDPDPQRMLKDLQRLLKYTKTT